MLSHVSLPYSLSSSFLGCQKLFNRSISYEEYVSFIPLANRPELEKRVDYQHSGVDKHLHEISALLLEWEDLIPHLGLTEIDKIDVLHGDSNPRLQRCVHN